MPTAIEKALDFIGGMNTSASVPHSMDESTAKGILKYLHELGVPANPADVMARGEKEGWDAGFTEKVAGWADKIASGKRIVIKNPEFFTVYMREQLQALLPQYQFVGQARNRRRQFMNEHSDILFLKDRFELLEEKTEVQSIREHLQKKQEQTSERKKTSKKHEQER